MEFTLEIIAFLMMVAFVAGFIDALAGGGGLIVIPALMAVGVPPLSAIATNKVQSTLGTGGAVVAFTRKGHIDFRKFALPAIGAFLGSATGAYLMQLINPAFLAGFIPLLLIAMTVYFLVAPKLSEDDRHSRLGPIGLFVVFYLIGVYDGFFGPGTGSFMTAALIALGGFGIVRATANTKFLNLAGNLSGLIVWVAGGHVLWVSGSLMAIANILGNQLGAHSAMRFGVRAVRPLLVLMCIVFTIKLLSDPTNPLRTLLFP